MSQDIKETIAQEPAQNSPAAAKNDAPGQSWKQGEEHVLPHNRIGIVFFGLMACTFLAALDQVRTAENSYDYRGLTVTSADHRCYGSAHHSPRPRWRKGLQLGGNVSVLQLS